MLDDWRRQAAAENLPPRERAPLPAARLVRPQRHRAEAIFVALFVVACAIVHVALALEPAHVRLHP
ncbi:MAG TPA: hypothetical protein VLX92_32000 [Kofleriaceae bacterium]|nr:hypothetical protein [Kofleriaceae bacterium]